MENDKDNFLSWSEKAIEANPNAPIRRALMIAYATEEDNLDLANFHFSALNKFAPNFIKSVLSGENILFADGKHKERLNAGLNMFLQKRTKSP